MLSLKDFASFSWFAEGVSVNLFDGSRIMQRPRKEIGTSLDF